MKYNFGELKVFVKGIVNSVSKITLKEWDAVKRQESILANCLNHDEGRLRGVKLPGLILNTSYVKSVKEGDVEIQLFHDYPLSGTSRSFRRGKLVDVVLSGSKPSQKEWASVRGIVSAVYSNAINVQISSIGNNFLLPHYVKNSEFCEVDLQQRSSSDIMKMSMQALENIKLSRNNRDKAALMLNNDSQTETEECENMEKPAKPILMNENFLDDDKIETVKLCSQKHPITIIHGPPGTGKTTALAAVILSEVANGSRVLATAPSHAAVDALTLAILRQWNENILCLPWSKLLRVGNALRLSDSRVEPWLPKPNINSTHYFEELESTRNSLMKSSENYDKKLLKDEEETLVKKLRKTSREDNFNQVSNSLVVTTTCLTGLNWPKNIINQFDVVCIDEAAFAPDWLTLPLALSEVPRLILSGDHYQLPPVSVSNNKSTSLMEKLIGIVPTATLTQQFRSNSIISDWSSDFFYEGKLRAHPTVAKTNLNDLVKKKNELLEQSLVFLDTSCHKFYEDMGDDNSANHGSICNLNEAYIIEIVLQKYLKLGIQAKDIGIITPYWSQVAVLREMFGDITNLDISTVDGFQGCEKELIIISFVRSNPKKQVGFLSEIRRINVTVTRAKRCCFVIGDIETLSSDENLKSFVQYCKHHSVIVDAEKYIF